MHKKLFSAALWLPLFSIWIIGCKQSELPKDQVFTSPTFSVTLEVNADQETHGSMIVTNTGDTVFPGDEAFGAGMNLWDQTAAPRFKIEAPIIREIQPGESIFLTSGRWHLDPGVYFLTWGSPKYGGSITVFSVVEEAGRLYLGNSQSFRTKPTDYEVAAPRAGSVRSFNLGENGSLFIMGETPLPDHSCVFPLIFDREGLLDGFPTGQCASIAEGRWQLQIPVNSMGQEIRIQPDTSYRVILFSNDLTTPPSEPFEIQISPPVEK